MADRPSGVVEHCGSVSSMGKQPISLVIGGDTVRVLSSASEGELQELAAVVGAKVAALSPKGRPPPPQAVFLAAIALAEELAVERERRLALERKTRDLLRRVLVRVEDALDSQDPEPT